MSIVGLWLNLNSTMKHATFFFIGSDSTEQVQGDLCKKKFGHIFFQVS